MINAIIVDDEPYCCQDPGYTALTRYCPMVEGQQAFTIQV
jgi:hypothetical protein